MRVTLVCKAEFEDNFTVGKEYDFTFESAPDGIDGYIINDCGWCHYMELPSNSHRFPDEEWHANDYFCEVVHDPEH